MIRRLPKFHLMAITLVCSISLLVLFWPADDASVSAPAADDKIVKPLTLDLDKAKSNQLVGQPTQDPADVVRAHAEMGQDMSGVTEHFIEIKKGDTVSHIFDRLHIPPRTLMELLVADEEHLQLGNVQPGQSIKATLDDDNKLTQLILNIDIANQLTFKLEDGNYVADLYTNPGKWSQRAVSGEIRGSFEASARKGGVKRSSVAHVAKLLENRLKFKNLRAGDKFYMVLNEQRINGAEVYQEEVLGVVIKSRNNTYSAFISQDGSYYDEKGQGLTKAYRKSPINGRYRISSHFNLKRKHPVTGKIRPHYGTDWATPIGTSVYSIGDGVVERVANHPLAGKYLVIKHGRKYTTRYLHLSKILVRKGQRVSMGEKVAKTGNTGRSTGAHLHYEFHINGRQVNPLKVKLPYSASVPENQMASFKQSVKSMKKEMGI